MNAVFLAIPLIRGSVWDFGAVLDREALQARGAFCAAGREGKSGVLGLSGSKRRAFDLSVFPQDYSRSVLAVFRIGGFRVGNPVQHCVCFPLYEAKRKRLQYVGIVSNFPQPDVCGVFRVFPGLRAADAFLGIVHPPPGVSNLVALDYPVGRALVHRGIRRGLYRLHAQNKALYLIVLQGGAPQWN